MAGILDTYLNPQPAYGGILGEAEMKSAQQKGLLGGLAYVAQALSQAGQPTRFPGGGIGSALGAFPIGQAQAQNDAMNQAVQSKMAGLQFDKANMEMQQAKDKNAAMQRIASRMGPQPYQVADASGNTPPPSFDMASALRAPGMFGDLVSAYGLPAAVEMGRKQRDIQKLGPGDKAIDAVTGQVVGENPAAPKAPTMRSRMEGGTEIQEEYQPDGTWRQVGKGPRWQPPQADPGTRIAGISAIRKELQGRPEFQNWQAVSPILDSMEDAAPRNSRAADLNLVYGLGKIMDPNSVVREGEMVMVKDTASLPGWLVGEIKRLNGGGALQPETRNQIMTEARSRGSFLYNQAKSVSDQYGAYAQRNGLPADDIVFGLTPLKNRPAPSGAAAPQMSVPAPPPGFRVVN